MPRLQTVGTAPKTMMKLPTTCSFHVDRDYVGYLSCKANLYVEECSLVTDSLQDALLLYSLADFHCL